MYQYAPITNTDQCLRQSILVDSSITMTAILECTCVSLGRLTGYLKMYMTRKCLLAQTNHFVYPRCGIRVDRPHLKRECSNLSPNCDSRNYIKMYVD